MDRLIVLDNPDRWPFDIRGVRLVSAHDYVSGDALHGHARTRVFNLCSGYGYQSLGYYVSLLAEARGHRPSPNIASMIDTRSSAIARAIAGNLDELIDKNLATIKSDTFALSVYFGQNLAQRYARLSARLFSLYNAPLLRAHMHRNGDGRWELRTVNAIGSDSVPKTHHEFLFEAARRYFARAAPPRGRKKAPRYSLAILTDPKATEPPSDERTIAKFMKAARKVGMEPWLIDSSDYGQIAEFDALFIRETTQVNHHTYRFASRAHAEGLAVIDDPQSILRCTNKVYLAELLQRHNIATPKTVVVHRDNIQSAAATLGLPCVLKVPDGSFSHGVKKVSTLAEFQQVAGVMLETSQLIVGQEFTPSEFDWRIGVLDGQPLYACKYYMVAKHWQIAKHDRGRSRWGKTETLPIAEVPAKVLKTALKATALIGNGLYGVDAKQLGKRVCIIEVNDNPTIDAGGEDQVLGQALYERIMQSLVNRIEAAQQQASST